MQRLRRTFSLLSEYLMSNLPGRKPNESTHSHQYHSRPTPQTVWPYLLSRSIARSPLQVSVNRLPEDWRRPSGRSCQFCLRTSEGDLKTRNFGVSSAWRIAQTFPLASCRGNGYSRGRGEPLDDADPVARPSIHS